METNHTEEADGDNEVFASRKEAISHVKRQLAAELSARIRYAKSGADIAVALREFREKWHGVEKVVRFRAVRRGLGPWLVVAAWGLWVFLLDKPLTQGVAAGRATEIADELQIAFWVLVERGDLLRPAVYAGVVGILCLLPWGWQDQPRGRRRVRLPRLWEAVMALPELILLVLSLLMLADLWADGLIDGTPWAFQGSGWSFRSPSHYLLGLIKSIFAGTITCALITLRWGAERPRLVAAWLGAGPAFGYVGAMMVMALSICDKCR